MPETPTREALHGACPCRNQEFLEQTDSRARQCNRPFCPCYVEHVRHDPELPEGYQIEPCEWPSHGLIDAAFDRLDGAEHDLEAVTAARDEYCICLGQEIERRERAERENAELRKERK